MCGQRSWRRDCVVLAPARRVEAPHTEAASCDESQALAVVMGPNVMQVGTNGNARRIEGVRIVDSVGSSVLVNSSKSSNHR